VNKYYVYAYICPTTHTIRYIGKGTRDRASVHIRRASQGTYPVENRRLHQWLVALEREKLLRPIIVKLATGLSESDAFALEAALISYHHCSKNNQLLNKKKGGTN
jgi:hypothetical protein